MNVISHNSTIGSPITPLGRNSPTPSPKEQQLSNENRSLSADNDRLNSEIRQLESRKERLESENRTLRGDLSRLEGRNTTSATTQSTASRPNDEGGPLIDTYA